MIFRIRSSVVPGLIVAVAPVLGLVAGGCGEDFESCEATRTCPSAGKGGAAGSAGEGGSAGTATSGGSAGSSGTSGGASGAGGSGGGASGASGASGDGGAAGDEGGAGDAGESGAGGSGGSAGRGGAGGSVSGASGSGGEGGDSVAPPDPCEGVTCVNGECADVGGVGVCECETGFAGERCELPSFEWIEFLSGHDYAEPSAISESGTVFGLSCKFNGCSTPSVNFRWTHENGTSAFGGADILGISDTSRDASVVVGTLSGTTSGNRAFRWTQASGFVNLGILPGGEASLASYANGVSADGSVVVGSSGKEAFLWTSGAGMVKLAMPDGRPSNSSGFASAVSDDGSVVAGRLSSATSSVLRWTSAGVVEWIEPSLDAYPTGMSADGEVIIGSAEFAGVTEAFRWTRLGGIVSLGRPTECSSTSSSAVSGNGRVVAVRCSSSSGIRSYLWDVVGGYRRLEDVLESIGAHATDGDEINTYQLSFDGSTIVGVAFPPGTAETRPWIARLPAFRD